MHQAEAEFGMSRSAPHLIYVADKWYIVYHLSARTLYESVLPSTPEEVLSTVEAEHIPPTVAVREETKEADGKPMPRQRTSIGAAHDDHIIKPILPSSALSASQAGDAYLLVQASVLGGDPQDYTSVFALESFHHSYACNSSPYSYPRALKVLAN
jgi:hypothetical protein